MLITNSAISLSSSHDAIEKQDQGESLRYWQNGQEPREIMRQGNRANGDLQMIASRVETSSLEVNFSLEAKALQPQASLSEGDETLDFMTDLEFSALAMLVEKITGRPLRVFNANQLKSPNEIQATDIQSPKAPASSGRGSAGWGMAYDYYESHYEYESTQLKAQGVVRTADGQEISIELELNMTREFYSETRVSLRAGDALKDPLVLNFRGNAAELTKTKFSFDIDADGHLDQISFLKPGSGFLALDKNLDGKVNDGSELFGALSGNGFGDLAGYDDDQNGWIDEADSIFSKLRIWEKSEEGEDRLVALGNRHVGAIYLGHIDTPFKLADPDNQQLGQVRDSGLFLAEDGSAGTVQQIDLVV